MDARALSILVAAAAVLLLVYVFVTCNKMRKSGFEGPQYGWDLRDTYGGYSPAPLYGCRDWSPKKECYVRCVHAPNGESYARCMETCL